MHAHTLTPPHTVYLEITDMSNHIGQQGVAGNVERDTKTLSTKSFNQPSPADTPLTISADLWYSWQDNSPLQT